MEFSFFQIFAYLGVCLSNKLLLVNNRLCSLHSHAGKSDGTRWCSPRYYAINNIATSDRPAGQVPSFRGSMGYCLRGGHEQ